MVPNVTAKGRSFNGAFAYYMHDKRQDGEARRDTAERVAWAETRNLATDDPDVARRVMVATAQHQTALKKAAGVRSTGRQSTQHVYAYSLSWRPDEAATLDRAEMVRAADASLKVLGADHLQTVIICHTDTKHPHVHLIVNRVDPETGRMHTFSNDRHHLDRWAHAYEEARGRIVTPNRAKKFQDRARGLSATFEAAAAPRRASPAADFNRAAAPVGDRQLLQAKAAELAKHTAAMRSRHSAEWRDLSAHGQARRNAAFDAAKVDLAKARSTIKDEFKPFWRDLFKRQAMEKRALRRASLMALAWTGWTLTRDEREGQKVDLAFLASVASFVMSKPDRERRLAAHHEREQRELGGLVRRATSSTERDVRAARADALVLERVAFLARRADLIEQQAREKARNRDAWREITAAKEALRGSRPRDPAGRHFQTAGEIRRAAGVVDRQATRDRTRSRSRTRSRTHDDPKPQDP